MSLEQFDPKELYKQSAPGFGHGLLKYWAFEEGLTHLNTGSYGAVPLPIQYTINKLTMKIESHPDHYIRIAYAEQLIDVRRKVAQPVGADLDELVLVQNSSTGINTVLRNLVWEKGDIIVSFNTSFVADTATAQSIADTPPYPTLIKIELLFPIIQKFKDGLAGLPPVEGRKVLAIIDSMHSVPGVLLPWKNSS